MWIVCKNAIDVRLLEYDDFYSENKENIFVQNVGPKHKDKKITISVEGNIGSGKSTFLQNFDKLPEVKVIPEPVHLWKNVKGHNTLEMMYKDARRWSLAFQSYVQLTTVDVHTSELKKSCRVKLMERSIYSARYCFVENLHQSGMMADVDCAILDEWFKWIMQNVPVNLDLIVYMRAKPETCLRRIHERQRSEETSVSLDYLNTLHKLHEDWLMHQKRYKLPARLLVLDAEKDVPSLVKKFEMEKSQLFAGVW